MSLTLRIFLIMLLIVQIFMIINTIHRKNISMKYASFWIAVLVILIFFAIFPNIILRISPLLGFEKSSNMVFLLGFFIVFYVLFLLTLSVSKQNIKLKNTIQELSILKEKVKKYEERD